jgi:hypothetical protein
VSDVETTTIAMAFDRVKKMNPANLSSKNKVPAKALMHPTPISSKRAQHKNIVTTLGTKEK